jgi:hypothetical protein
MNVSERGGGISMHGVYMAVSTGIVFGTGIIYTSNYYDNTIDGDCCYHCDNE